MHRSAGLRACELVSDTQGVVLEQTSVAAAVQGEQRGQPPPHRGVSGILLEYHDIPDVHDSNDELPEDGAAV